jgi:ELWxxDGT repeat protein
VATLWASAGTPSGTQPLRSFERIGALVASGGRVYFSATTREHGSELWTTDGTVAGTRLVLDAVPGPESSDPALRTDVGGILMFSARTAAAGNEPWASNGTAEGTRPIADVAPGVAGSLPQDFTPLDDRVLFSARRGDVGRELFSLPRSALTALCVADEEKLCLGGGRFRLEVEWRDFDGDTGSGHVVPHFAADSGLFYFFDPDNWEMLVKVLDGCGFNDHYWVFSAATTNVEYTLRVTDTARGVTREYHNPLGVAAAAVTDTAAFATCP